MPKPNTLFPEINKNPRNGSYDFGNNGIIEIFIDRSVTCHFSTQKNNKFDKKMKFGF